MPRRTRVAIATALCCLAVPAASQAATKAVTAGPPLTKAPAGYPRDGDIDAFFPSSIKVHAGDSIKFTLAGFHTVNFPKKGGSAPPLAVPDPAHPATGILDTAGAPFWFNGQGIPVIPPIVGLGSGSGKPYTGATAVGSGAPAGPGKPKPFVVKFPKTGRFTYYCAVHPGMKATVSVVGKTKTIPSAKADAARVKTQLAAAVAGVKKLAAAPAPATPNTVTTGPDAKTGPVLLRFTPATLTTTVGAPVTFEMTPGSPEAHTFTFSKDVTALAAAADATFVGPLAGTGVTGPPVLAIDPKFAYPSEAPGTPVTYNGTAHGDGFLNSGIVDGSSATPFPDKFSVTFTQPGTYTYLCAIHTFMHGSVVVQ